MNRRIEMLCIGLFIFWTNMVYAQEPKTIHQNITVSVSNNESLSIPENGPVLIQTKAIEGGQVVISKVQGHHQYNKPIGKWSWQTAQWNVTMEAGVSAQPLFSSVGKTMKWQGEFSKGIPNGTWIFNVDSIASNGKIIKSLVKVHLQYKNGIPIGKFAVEDNSTSARLKMQGTTDANGIANGIWYFEYWDANKQYHKEERQYKNGLLHSITTIEGTKRKVVPLAHNQNYLNLSTLDTEQRIGEDDFINDEMPGLGSQMLRNVWVNHFQDGWKHSQFEWQEKWRVPNFKKLEYPLKEAELALINSSRAQIANQSKMLDVALTDNVNILRSRSVLLDTTIAYLQLQKTRLQLMDSLMLRTENPAFRYKNRLQHGVEHWLAGINNLRTAYGEANDTIIVEMPLLSSVSFDYNILKTISNHLEQNEMTLVSYLKTVEDAQQEVKREGHLKELENKISNKLTDLQSFYSHQEGIGKLINEQWLKSYVNQSIQAYSQIKDYNKALEAGKAILFVLDSLEAWKPQLEVYNQMPSSIQSQYSYLAYNPFSGLNDIEVRIKKRFITNVLENLWPYLGKEMTSENDWETFVTKWNQQFDVYHFLLGFVSKDDANAKRIENKVRKERKPEKMLKLLSENK